MSKRIHKLAQQLFDKPTVEECTYEEVNDLAQRFPYFAPAQFLLLEKLGNPIFCRIFAALELCGSTIPGYIYDSYGYFTTIL